MAEDFLTESDNQHRIGGRETAGLAGESTGLQGRGDRAADRIIELLQGGGPALSGLEDTDDQGRAAGGSGADGAKHARLRWTEDREMESDVVVYRRMSVQRVIDSSSNRLAEALRVMEDVARYTLDREDLVTALKSMRHEIRR